MLDATESHATTNSAPIAAAGPVVIASQRDVLRWARAAIEAMNISRATVDERCGFGDRYSNNLLSPQPSKRVAFGSMLALVRGLAHEIHIVPNADAMAVLLTEVTTRKIRVGIRAVQNGKGKHTLVSKRFLRKIARLGGAARAARMNPSWRRGVARRAALARWAKAKATRPTVGRSHDG